MDLSTLVVSARIELPWIAHVNYAVYVGVGMVACPATFGLWMVLRPFSLMNLVVL